MGMADAGGSQRGDQAPILVPQVEDQAGGVGDGEPLHANSIVVDRPQDDDPGPLAFQAVRQPADVPLGAAAAAVGEEEKGRPRSAQSCHIDVATKDPRRVGGPMALQQRCQWPVMVPLLGRDAPGEHRPRADARIEPAPPLTHERVGRQDATPGRQHSRDRHGPRRAPPDMSGAITSRRASQQLRLR